MTTNDGNVCHLTYRLYSPPDLSLKYDIDFIDVQFNSIKVVPGGSSDHWPGIALNTISGRQFNVDGSVMGIHLRPTDALKLIYGLFEDPNIKSTLNNFRALAKECGAK